MLKKVTIISSFLLGSISVASAQCIEGNCYNSNGTFRFENGDEYKGQWKKGKQEGYGVYEFINGDTYKGAWKDGVMEGRGTYTYANGDKYIGMWKEGKMNGRGHFHWNLPGDLMTNAVYEGFFKDGKPKNIEFKDTGTPSAQPEK